MAQVCPNCRATVGDDATLCERCETRLDPCPTIPPARPRPGVLRGESPQDRPSKRPDREDRNDRELRHEPPVASPKPRSNRVRPPSPPRGAPPQQPAAPGPPQAAPLYLSHRPFPGTSPDMPPSIAAGTGPDYPGSGAPSGVRGWMIRMLGGRPEAPAPPPPPPYHPPQVAYPGYPPQGAPPQGYSHQPPSSPLPAPPAANQWAPQPPPPHAAPQSQGPPPAPVHEAPRHAFESQAIGTSDDDCGQTRFIGGVDISKLNIPKASFSLQILDTSGQWSDLGPIHANGRNVGRSTNSAGVPGLGSMAVRHLKFTYDRAKLRVEDLGSLNGVYLRITELVELVDGMRLRIGGQLIEFHTEDSFDRVPPLTSEEGEEFYSRDAESLAYLDLIRPNGRPGLRFPIVNLGATVIGREGPGVNIALINDPSVSGRHAQIRREDNKFFLEDLKSRNGTYINLLDPHELKSGDVVQAGLVYFRVVDQTGM